jgi:large subunit ribosomal protein L29
MKKIDLKQLTVAEIKDMVADEKSSLAKMKFNNAISPLENPLKIRTTRRNIARMLTELKNRSTQTTA